MGGGDPQLNASLFGLGRYGGDLLQLFLLFSILARHLIDPLDVGALGPVLPGGDVHRLEGPGVPVDPQCHPGEEEHLPHLVEFIVGEAPGIVVRAGYGGGASPQGGGYSDPFGFGGPFGWGPFGGGTTSRRRSRAYRPRAGADVVYELTVDAETASKGTRRGVTYQRYASCDVCHGSGSVESDHPATCPTCGGRGHITVDTGLFGVMAMTCPECEGTGRVVADPCSACGGSGRTLSASEVVVDVPAGTHDGDEIRVPGMGNAGTNGSEAGDFVCRVCVPEERLTRRQASGFNLIGFALPFLAFGLFAGTLSSLVVFIVLLVVFGGYFVVRDGIKGSARWWRNAGVAVLNGISNGFFMALFIAMMFSCTRRPYYLF